MLATISQAFDPALAAIPDISAFMAEHKRIPILGDPVAPWRYRGWLLQHVWIADAHPALPGRWDHYWRTQEAGRLLDEPIPKIHFETVANHAGRKMLEKCLELISRGGHSWSAFQQLIDWLSWGLAMSNAHPSLDEQTQESLYRTFNLEPLLLHPHDYLGTILSEQRSGGWNPHAFFPTPHSVVELMVQVNFDGGSGSRDQRLALGCDPCLGTGRMLLHASNYAYCLYGCDIDPLVVAISRINAALYSPWLAFPFSDSILGRALPPPPPEELPIPESHRLVADAPLLRCDDRGQGLLFG